jgi:CDP-diacylglycerol--glycerol-3-phosphate 3-phosphatidyltransferase
VFEGVFGADDRRHSRANLSDTYFTNRQDRYYHVRNQPSILSYLYSLQRLYSSYSYRLSPKPQPSSSPHHLIPLTPLPDYASQYPNSRPALVWPEPSVHPRHFPSHALATITAFQRVWRESRRGRRVDVDTWIFPMIQGGALGVEEEERGVGKLLQAAEAMQGQAQVDLTSGYFGLYHTYKKAVLEGKAPYRIVAAAPEVRTVGRQERVHGVSARLTRKDRMISIGQWVLWFGGRVEVDSRRVYVVGIAIPSRLGSTGSGLDCRSRRFGTGS